ncbi:unnamed protein product [Prunus armeniaca]
MEQIVQECARLLSHKGSKGASGSLATSSGNFGCCLSASDTGATDHMTSKLDFLSRYSSPSKTCVTTADGSPIPVDQRTGATIGRGSEKGGLYLLDDPAGCTSSPTVHALQSATDSSRDICYTPQQNGVAERKNRHLLEVARSLLLSIYVPKSYWGEAVLTAAYLINRMPSQVLKFQTPLQVFTAACSPSIVNHLPPRVFGCISFVHLHHSGKLDPHSLKCIFLGYSATQKGYKCYHPPSKKFFVTRDVTFHEEHAYFSHLSSETSLQGENISSEDKSYGVPMFELEKIEQNESEKNDTRREGNSLTLPPVGHRMSPYDLVYTKRDKVPFQRNDQSAAPVTGNSEVEFVEPSCSLLENNPINFVPSIDNELPIALRRPLRSCPSKYKYPISNFMSSHRLSPCLKSFAYQLSSVSVPQTLQDALDNPRWKEAMDEELRALRKNSTWELVELPRGKKVVGCKWVFTIKHKADGSVDRYKARLVAKGYTQTYGIDYQDTFAPVAKMNTIRVLLSLAANLGWTLQQFDVKNAFLHGYLEEEVYMDMPPDDIIMTGDDIEEISKLKIQLAKEFDIKDLGTLRYFLGIEVAHSKEGIFISQRKYVLDLLTETGMLACKPADTPIEQNHRLGEQTDDTPVDRGRYQRLVGKLIYLAHTRPDIAYAHDNFAIEAYTDADWAGSVSDRRSTTGYCMFVGGNLVTWRSKKQSVVARSSAEAEFKAMAHGVCELLWLKILFRDLRITIQGPMRLFCDNKAAISIAHNPLQHDRTKHIEIDRHFIKEKLSQGLICTPYVKTNDQLADILTKGVSSKVFESSLAKLGIQDIYSR